MIRIGREIQCLPYAGFFGIGTAIRTRREVECLPYAEFFNGNNCLGINIVYCIAYIPCCYIPLETVTLAFCFWLIIRQFLAISFKNGYEIRTWKDL